MGVTGLLPFLKKIHEPVNVGKFAGCTVAIDAYCWLHKGAFSCAEKLALSEKTDQYVYYCMKFINTLLAKNIKPVLVFDGCHLPSKKNVEKSRREKREMNRKKAAQFLREGRRAEARECLQRCIDISPEMALELMNVCRSKGVDCIVAPYEADAQLAYLNKIGVAQVVITEDSDLLLFGCEKVLFKMDHAGNGVLIERSRLNEVMELQTGHFTFDKFRYMCILSGCDYLPSLSGIGLAKANKVFKLARQSDLQQLLKKLSTYLKSNISVPQEYIDGFIQANNTFLHQLVYDPLQRKLVPLNPYPSDIRQEDVTYAGPHISSDRAYQLALGNINIYTNEKFADYDPDTYVPKYVKKRPESLHLLSIWDKHYRIRPKPGLTEVQPCDRPVLKGKEIEVKAKFKRPSPKKRLREAEDSSDVKTDAELSDLYLQQSPVKKRVKTEIDSDVLQRFMFPDRVEQYKDNEDLGQEEVEVEDIEKKPGPKFFSSLSEAHSVQNDTEQQNMENKENGVTSPRRNVFAHKSPSKKSRFDLNAAKSQDVKSRFFAKTSNPIRLSNKLNNKPKEVKSKSEELKTDKPNLSGYKLVHENTANIKVGNSSKDSTAASPESTKLDQQDCDKSESDNEDITVNDSKVDESKSKLKFNEAVNNKLYTQSPTSAFNWGKFKFNSKEKSNSGSGSSLSSPLTSKSLCIFKRKYETNSESALDMDIERKDTSETGRLGEDEQSDSNKGEIDCEENEAGTSENTDIVNSAEDSSLGSSYPYSIDTDCLPSLPDELSLDSQQSVNSQGSNNQTSIQRKKSGLNLYFKPTTETDTDKIKIKEKATSNGDDDDVVITGSESQNSDVGSSKKSLNSSQAPVTSQPKRKGLSIYFKPAVSSSTSDTSNVDKAVSDDAELDKVTDIQTDGTDNTDDAHISESDVVVIGSDSEDCDTDRTADQKKMKVKSFPLKSPKSQKAKAKSGCRVSGLSKKSKTLSEQDTSKQKSLKDMFSKFAHTKSLKPRINHEDDAVYTPESETSVLNKETRVQKHLQI